MGSAVPNVRGRLMLCRLQALSTKNKGKIKNKSIHYRWQESWPSGMADHLSPPQPEFDAGSGHPAVLVNKDSSNSLCAQQHA